MRFDSDKAFEQLTKYGIVATMRMNRKVKVGRRRVDMYMRGMVVWITRNGKRVSKGVIVDVVPNTLENRKNMLRSAGLEASWSGRWKQ